MIEFKISAKSTRNSSLGYTRPQELADLRFGPSLAVFTVNYSVSDLGSYVVCAPYFSQLLVAPLGFEPRLRGLEPPVLAITPQGSKMWLLFRRAT